MLALYPLFSGTPIADLSGADAVMADAGAKSLPKVKRVVLVGNKISPGNPATKPDGTVIRTLWGELAWQLGGKTAFNRVAKDDENATSPGDVLRELFVEHGPCLVLIDEWVAYARQLHDQSDLRAGSFETMFTFAQALTESAKLANNCLLVVGRVESSWRPATAEEGFEIVRRRLFEAIPGDQFKNRDLTARAFSELYHVQSAEFPPECRSADYEKRMQAAYPIHPEVFDRLHSDRFTLVKFQRTRGVLRLMAAVIHCLWEKGDKNPLILPSTIPIDDARVQFELTRYLSDAWAPIIERDVDGPNSLPLRIDTEQPNLGRLHATRRVARTVYMGSAPTSPTTRVHGWWYCRRNTSTRRTAPARRRRQRRRCWNRVATVRVCSATVWCFSRPTRRGCRTSTMPSADIWHGSRSLRRLTSSILANTSADRRTRS
jgi:predicted AAA+ superfamily ATPase